MTNMATKNKEIQELFQAPAQIMKLETMSDGGIRIVIDTSEMTDPQELAKLFRLKKGAQGWFLFKDAKMIAMDVPDYDPTATDGPVKKTPSARLRSLMFVYFTQVLGKDPKDFDSYYEAYYDKLADQWKEKLPPRD